MITLRTTSVDETKAVAASLASLARAGDLIVLAGEMGAGKTAFAQGFAAGLGVLDPVTSPTFTLVHAYEGRLRVYHADLYRLDHLAEVADLALAELAEYDGIVLVEWGDVVESTFGEHLLVRLDQDDEATEARDITIRPFGRTWASRWGRLVSEAERVAQAGS